MPETLPDLVALLPSWQLALKAERKSAGTIRTYTDGVTKFLRWCDNTGTKPELTRAVVQAFLADLLDEGMEGNTARSRDLALKRYAAWLVDEGELSVNPLTGLKPPKADSKVVNALTDDELKRLIKACQGKSLQDRRDEAIVRLMAETGLRAGEVEQGHAEAGAADAVVAHGGEMAQDSSRQDPAGTEAEQVHVVRAGDLADHVDDLFDGQRIGVEVPVGMLGRRVPPAD